MAVNDPFLAHVAGGILVGFCGVFSTANAHWLREISFILFSYSFLGLLQELIWLSTSRLEMTLPSLVSLVTSYR